MGDNNKLEHAEELISLVLDQPIWMAISCIQNWFLVLDCKDEDFRQKVLTMLHRKYYLLFVKAKPYTKYFIRIAAVYLWFKIEDDDFIRRTALGRCNKVFETSLYQNFLEGNFDLYEDIADEIDDLESDSENHLDLVMRFLEKAIKENDQPRIVETIKYLFDECEEDLRHFVSTLIKINKTG